MAFPIHAKCVTFDAGYPGERDRARAELELGQTYTIQSMQVGQSSTSMTFWELPGTWNSVFFDAA